MGQKKHTTEEIVANLRHVDILVSQAQGCRSNQVHRGVDFEEGYIKEILSPARRRACVAYVVAEHGVFERFACRLLGQHRSTQ